MQNIEMALLTQVIVTRDFHTLEKTRITEEYFVEEQNKQLYRYLRSMYFDPATRGETPSLDMVKYRFPTAYFLASNDTVPVLASELRRERVRMELLFLATELENNAPLDPMETLAKLRTKSSELSALAEVGSDISLAGAFGMLRERYETVADAGGVIGIPYPWEALNEETQGMQGGQFIVLYGRPKSMKTWVGIALAEHAYISSRKRVMFYTREMSPQMICSRVAARVARVDYKKFRNGQLQPEARDRAFEILETLGDAEAAAGAYGHNQPIFEVVSDRGAGGSGGGVGWLQSKIRDIRPDIVFVDGMYLMRDDRSNQRSIDWKQIAHISQDLKLTAQEFDIPVIGITQANRAAEKSKGEDLTELAFSDSLGQDADAVFRASKKDIVDENTKIKRTEILLTAPGLREGTFDGIVLKAQPATHFDYLRTIVATDDDKKQDYQGSATHQGGGKMRSSFSNQRREPNVGPAKTSS